MGSERVGLLLQLDHLAAMFQGVGVPFLGSCLYLQVMIHDFVGVNPLQQNRLAPNKGAH